MKRIALLIIAMLTLGFAAQAQSTFTKGTTTANIGLGIGSTLFDKDFSVLLPPLSVGIDHSVASGLFDGNGSIGVGGYLGAEVYRYKGFDSSVWSQTLVGPRGSLHYQFVDKLDTYFSLMLGVNIISWNYNMKVADNAIKDKDTAAGFGWSAHIGARYYLSDRWAVMGELGYGLTFLTLGATYRF
ncbi:hypothetical protein PORUE0001_0866 [Porphyromonas uenonis 60-3]|uniref:Outer membrane protein beta-barrel domain-containing protein n=1 Tax=Porphyromonas uenonis 60-3 TaxID=596327 RepID=C2MC88_9PORP|nr:outer membrane beta-barrel protein [Porphyromonas uenonis]EEK16724.1 hypothetical protein PORUE0001_0866 [Porphyromonas uenonis 60-3]